MPGPVTWYGMTCACGPSKQLLAMRYCAPNKNSKMHIIRGLMRNTWLMLFGLLALAIFHESVSLREDLAQRIAPSFAYSPEDAVAKKHIDECEEKARRRSAFVICDFPMSVAAGEYVDEYIKEPAESFETAAAVGMGVLAFVLVVRVLFNTHALLKGRSNLTGIAGSRTVMRFLRSRRAELALRRYKRLLDTGVLSEEEFSAKRQELKATILNEG